MAVVSYALTIADRLADYLDISSPTAAQTALMETLINQATDFIEGYTGRRFKKTAYTNELYDGTATNMLNLKNYPVISTETFTLEYRDSADFEDRWDAFDSEDFQVEYSAGIIYLIKGNKFRATRQHYRATYTAGYDYDNVTTFASTVGIGDLEFACWRLASYVWNSVGADPAIESESIGDYSVKFNKALYAGIDGAANEMTSILDRYKNVDNMVGGTMAPPNT
jgi:hypothetical protein